MSSSFQQRGSARAPRLAFIVVWLPPSRVPWPLTGCMPLIKRGSSPPKPAAAASASSNATGRTVGCSSAEGAARRSVTARRREEEHAAGVKFTDGFPGQRRSAGVRPEDQQVHISGQRICSCDASAHWMSTELWGELIF